MSSDTEATDTEAADALRAVGLKRQMTVRKHQDHLERARNCRLPYKTLILGDSLTERLMSTGKHRVAEILRSSAFIAGVGGDRIENLIWRVANGIIETVNPDNIIVFIGVNNIGDTPHEEFEALYRVLFKSIRKHAKPNVKIAVLAIPARGDMVEAMYAEYITPINTLLEIQAQEHGLRFYSAFLNTFSRETFSDVVHFSERGYDIFVDGLLRVIADFEQQ